MTTNKLGPHVLRSAADLSEYIRAGVAVAKFVGDWGTARDVPAGALVIGRKHQGDYDAQSQRARGLSPLKAAREFVGDQWNTYASNPRIVYWEGHNEPVWNDLDGMAWYAQLEIERMKLMAAHGLKCVIGNFSAGAPPLALWPGFLPALRVARRYEAILGLHEYSCPWMWWMTGAYQIDPNEDEGDEGWTTLRYRKVYRQHLVPNGLGDVPLVITECGIDPLVNPKPPGCDGGTWKQLGDYWREHNDEPDKADYYFRQLVWYDEELQKDAYVVGATVFTWGNFGKPWVDFDVAGTGVATKLIAYTEQNPADPFAYPGTQSPQCGQPRVQYERTYVLLPPGVGKEWPSAVVHATWNSKRYTLGGSADDAGIGDLDVRRVIAVNPLKWSGNLREFFREHYPGVAVSYVEAGTPERLRQILAGETEDIALSQRDPRWASKDLGEDPGGETIGQAGCLLTSFAMCLRHAGRWIYPDQLNTILADAEIPFTNDDHLTNWPAAVELFDEFDDFAKANTRRGAATLAGMLSIGWEIVLRMPGGTHFVYLESVREDSLLNIIDPWDGQRKVRSPDLYAGIRAAHRTSSTPPPDFALRGVHDMCGAAWLKDNDLPGWCTVARYVGTDPQQLDLQQYADANVRVILRLTYSYAQDDGGAGTMPPPDKLSAHEDAVAETMRLNPSAWGFVYGNEPNNKREWPGGHPLTPAYYLASYNRVWARKPAGARLSPCAIDPYNPGWGDWRKSWYDVLCQVTGADFLALHAYTHGPNPSLIWHKKEFEDAPLIGVYYDMRVLESQQDIIPSRFQNLPVVVTETNHWVKNDGTVGWEPDAGDWVREAYKYFASKGVAGACLFRHGYIQWRYGDLPKILAALEGIA